MIALLRGEYMVDIIAGFITILIILIIYIFMIKTTLSDLIKVSRKKGENKYLISKHKYLNNVRLMKTGMYLISGLFTYSKHFNFNEEQVKKDFSENWYKSENMMFDLFIIYLKSEWERVKLEANSKSDENSINKISIQQNENLIELCHEFKNASKRKINTIEDSDFYKILYGNKDTK